MILKAFNSKPDFSFARLWLTNCKTKLGIKESSEICKLDSLFIHSKVDLYCHLIYVFWLGHHVFCSKWNNTQYSYSVNRISQVI